MKTVLGLIFLVGCADTDEGEGPPDPVSTVPTALDTCDRLGLPRVALQEGTGELRNEIAGDFSIPTTVGRWDFSDAFTGCDTYLFVPSIPAQEAGWDLDLWAEDGEELRGLLPENTHLFFVSVADDPAEVEADLALVQDNVEQGMRKLPDDEEEALRARLHYVSEGVDDIASWIGRALDDPGFGFGIDRTQRIRDIGSLADGERYSPAMGWFEPNLAHVAYEAVRYNWEAERDAALAIDGATVVTSHSRALVEDSGWAGIRSYGDLRLPDAAEMAAFDTLELDLTMDCDSDLEVGTADDPGCPDWDRIVEAFLCETDEVESCTIEAGRWISAYHRNGRWVSDASFLLPMLRAGGLRKVAMYSIDPYVITLDWRFSTRGVPSPATSEVAWRANASFDDTYPTNFPARQIAIPADAEKVELTVVISGHGMSVPDNCAEFCDSTHTFAVNGVEQTISFPETADPEYCQNDVVNGTVANQYGTWFYGRSNWCPGKVVHPIVLDFTDAVTPGTDAEVTYTATGPNGVFPGGSNIDLSVFLTSRN
ncbi:MAG: hypothetical protein H0V89_11745 [Deltaproteobacteria bacterium]|nr:hypothetical protein [Deltaproteobacteria bacterium]